MNILTSDLVAPDGQSEEANVEWLDESTWAHLRPEVEIAPGYLAWDILSIGRRFEMWIAWSVDRLTPVCVKIPRADNLTPGTISALRREHDAATAFTHPAIPRVFEANFDAPTPYIVHEFIEGKPLSRKIDDEGPLNNQDLIMLGLQLAAVLRHVHGRGYVHLDVKPSNVAIRGDRAILLDFDIALPIGGRRSTSKPRGTRYYIPPEQIRCEPAHPAMDLFALGTLLYEAASGTRAFDVETDDASTKSDDPPRKYRQLGEPIPTVGELVPGIHPSIAGVIDDLMALAPADRPPSAGEVIVRLEKAATEANVQSMWPGWVTRRSIRS
jgi:eukaryotic-like serine/threonine-protein kinase